MSEALLTLIITVGVQGIVAVIGHFLKRKSEDQTSNAVTEKDLRGDLLERVESLETKNDDLQKRLNEMTEKYLQKYGEAEILKAQRNAARACCNSVENRNGQPLTVWPNDDIV